MYFHIKLQFHKGMKEMIVLTLNIHKYIPML